MVTDLETWLLDYHDDKTLKIFEQKFIFTPYEEAHKFLDENRWEFLGTYKIEEAIELPDRDVILGCRYYDIDSKESGKTIEYFRLSTIKFEDITDTIED